MSVPEYRPDFTCGTDCGHIITGLTEADSLRAVCEWTCCREPKTAPPSMSAEALDGEPHIFEPLTPLQIAQGIWLVFGISGTCWAVVAAVLLRVT